MAGNTSFCWMSRISLPVCWRSMPPIRLIPFTSAFSCWLFNQQGQLLVTRRSLGKKPGPGMDQLGLRTPQQGETFEQAVTRRCRFELGVEISISRRFTRPSATGRSPQTVSLRTKCARYMPRAW
ncbi:NUDIX domain-containing protein [Klebsiella pneumoniae]|nr:NUDIX domain-containing protein [Klebsiella pneumoniae]